MKPDIKQQHLLAKYHDGQTTDAENQHVASLLAKQPECQQHLDELAALRSSLQTHYTQAPISDQLAKRLGDIPHAAQQHVITKLASGWAMAATIMLLLSGLALWQLQSDTDLNAESWQIDRMALGQNTAQYGVELADNHTDLQLASLLFADNSEDTQ